MIYFLRHAEHFDVMTYCVRHDAFCMSFYIVIYLHDDIDHQDFTLIQTIRYKYLSEGPSLKILADVIWREFINGLIRTALINSSFHVCMAIPKHAYTHTTHTHTPTHTKNTCIQNIYLFELHTYKHTKNSAKYCLC